MKKILKGRGISVLLWVAGFICGIFAENAWGIAGYGVQGAEMQQKAERQSGLDNKILPVVFYDDMGRKVCVREGAVLPLAEQLRMEIPLDNWMEGEMGQVEIKVFYKDGSEQRNSVSIQRKTLHKGEK